MASPRTTPGFLLTLVSPEPLAETAKETFWPSAPPPAELVRAGDEPRELDDRDELDRDRDRDRRGLDRPAVLSSSAAAARVVAAVADDSADNGILQRNE